MMMVATWTYPEVTAKLNDDGIEVSVSGVWRILSAMDIDLTKVRDWLNRRDDPDFGIGSVMCGLYLNPPGGAIVLSVDEKTAIAAFTEEVSIRAHGLGGTGLLSSVSPSWHSIVVRCDGRAFRSGVGRADRR
ncbi:MAG: hypothetical protein R2704_16230 [Microthrixaceae bacterium]